MGTALPSGSRLSKGSHAVCYSGSQNVNLAISCPLRGGKYSEVGLM